METITYNGQEYDVPVRLSGGYLDFMLRADTQADFDREAKLVGLMTQDDEGNWSDLRDVRRLGAYTITKAIEDEEGNVVTPAVIDTRYHVNVRLSAEMTAAGAWRGWAVAWMMAGTVDIAPNANETGLKLNGITLLEPDTLTPSEVIL